MYNKQRDTSTRLKASHTAELPATPQPARRRVRYSIPDETNVPPSARTRKTSRTPYTYQPDAPSTKHPKTAHKAGAKPAKRKSTRSWTHYAMLIVVIFFAVIGSISAYTVVTGKKVPTQSPATTSITTRGRPHQDSANITADMLTSAQKELKLFESHIASLKKAGKNTTIHQQRFEQDQASFSTINTRQEYVAFLLRIGIDLTQVQSDIADNRPRIMLDNYVKTVQQWGDEHKYKNSYDQKEYYLNTAYMSIDGRNGNLYGNGSYLKDAVNSGDTNAAGRIRDSYYLQAMFAANYEDNTPYDQAHQVDQELLKNFKLQNSHVLLVSLSEQSMRIYRNGKLEEALLVTTGRYYRPTPPGLFQMSLHQYNVPFTSFDTPDSPDYYKPVVISNAIQFWDNGYLIHSSQWRKDYGPLTNLPHKDSGGDPEANNGSHGCINVDPDTLKRLDKTITSATKLIIF